MNHLVAKLLSYANVYLATMILLVGGGEQLRAGIVYSNFGPGDSYQNAGYAIYPDEVALGMPFTPGLDYNLTRIELAAGLLDGPNVLDVSLMTSDGGVPGTVIETWHLIDALGPWPASKPLVVVDSVLHPLIRGGVQYWLTASTPVQDNFIGWNENSVGDRGAIADKRHDQDPWNLVPVNDRAVFRISGTSMSIPEPSSLAMGITASVLGLGYILVRYGVPKAAEQKTTLGCRNWLSSWVRWARTTRLLP